MCGLGESLDAIIYKINNRKQIVLHSVCIVHYIIIHNRLDALDVIGDDCKSCKSNVLLKLYKVIQRSI